MLALLALHLLLALLAPAVGARVGREVFLLVALGPLATSVWAATSPQLDGLGGVYCEDCDVAEPAVDGVFARVKDWASDPEQAARLWALSAELTGVDAFA